MNYFKSRVKTVVPALTLLMTVVALSWYPVSRAQQSAVSPGTGDATFKPPVSYTAGTQPASIATGDFNSDGKPDLAEVNQVTNRQSDQRPFAESGKQHDLSRVGYCLLTNAGARSKRLNQDDHK